MKQQKQIKVLLAKSSLDGHDRGIQVLSQMLKEEGMEVIYTGLRKSPEQIVERAVEENVDVIGLSSLSGGHNVFFPRVIELARMKGMSDVLIIAGGIIPQDDTSHLNKKGISAIFGPGTPVKEIADYIRGHVRNDE